MLVMWVLTLLTVMAVSLTATQRTETALTENHVSGARFRAVADAAIAYAALDFMVPPTAEQAEDAETTWLPNGVPRTWSFGGSTLSIAVFNEMSKLNLNRAQPETLTNLLTVLGVSEEDATALAAAIVDWRDEDDAALLNGAEDADYKEAGNAIGAKDDAYASVEELRQVLGMSEEIYQRLLPEVTVDGESATPDERFASPAVLAALRGISLEEAVDEVAERDLTSIPGATAARAVDRGGPLYRIQVTEQGEDRAGRRMEALIQLAGGAQQGSPIQILWRRYDLSLQDPVYREPESE